MIRNSGVNMPVEPTRTRSANQTNFWTMSGKMETTGATLAGMLVE